MSVPHRLADPNHPHHGATKHLADPGHPKVKKTTHKALGPKPPKKVAKRVPAKVVHRSTAGKKPAHAKAPKVHTPKPKIVHKHTVKKIRTTKRVHTIRAHKRRHR